MFKKISIVLITLIILLNVLSPLNIGNKEAYATEPTIATVPNGPEGKFFTYGDGKGYVDLTWDSVPHATGYKVWVWNGVTYESFDVGNKTNWSTKGKAIWPTETEISQGKFNLHRDSSKPGSELVLNPSYVYANAGTAYRTNKNYYFRISAYNSEGESAYSTKFYKQTMPNMILPTTPEADPNTSEDTERPTGYVDLQWEPVENATGYKVWIFNGKSYQSIDVGDTTQWSTFAQGLWPTQEEISNGRYRLHTDGEGEDLAIDPSPVYVNSKGDYGADSKNYKLRITAYNNLGETVYSGFTKPTIEPDEVIPEDEIESVEKVLFEDYSYFDDTTNNVTRKDFKTDEEYQEWLSQNSFYTTKRGWLKPAFDAVVKIVKTKKGTKRVVKQTLRKSYKNIDVKNGKLANSVHPVTGVKFNGMGFPIFKYKSQIKLPYDMIKSSNDRQFRYCNQQLAIKIEKDFKLKSQFTTGQIASIRKGNNPVGYTWHHHEKRGNMQLVDYTIHKKTGHTGGKSIWGKL
ncbi:HNH endonuclease [Peribacillus sp. NPDC006672]|uniref:HNH endonuclease n=1 Tax=Peribacillus sp. NPDC006672 TaxID=3390606 RepID=UPI003CFF7943